MEQFLHFFKNPENIVQRFTSIQLKFDFSMKVTFKGIASNVTVKFTLACKCHVLADLKKMPIFGEKKLRFAKKFHTGFGRVFSVSNFLHS